MCVVEPRESVGEDRSRNAVVVLLYNFFKGAAKSRVTVAYSNSVEVPRISQIVDSSDDIHLTDQSTSSALGLHAPLLCIVIMLVNVDMPYSLGIHVITTRRHEWHQ